MFLDKIRSHLCQIYTDLVLFTQRHSNDAKKKDSNEHLLLEGHGIANEQFEIRMCL